MAEEQIIVDIKVDSKDVDTADKRIDKLTDSIEVLGNSIKDARDQNKKYKKEQQDLNEQYRQGKITAEQYEKGVDTINKKIKDNNKRIAENSIELQKQKRERNANIKLINSESNSRDQLRQKVAILTKEYNELNTETKEGRDRSDALQKELKQLNKELNEGSKASGNFKDNIGNYPEAAGGAIISLEAIGDGLENVGGSSAGAVGGIKSIGAAFKALLANPVVLVLAAIVGALSALFSAFKRSESGSKLLGKAMAGLKGIMAVVTKLADAIGNAFTSSMDDAGESTVSFWEKLKQNFVNRITGLLDLMRSVGDGISALFSGSAEELEKAGEKAKTALIQIGTGLDELQQEEAVEGFKKLRDEAVKITKSFIDLEAAQRANRASVRFLEKDVAKLSAEFEMLAEVAGDDTRNMEEMRQAAIDAGEAAATLATKQVKLSKARLSIINQEVAVRRGAGEDIQDLLDEQAQAEVALTEAKSQAAIAQQKILIEQRKIERDLFEQNLDILLDVGDKIKTEQEKAIKNESFTLAKRRKLLADSQAALEANFAAIKDEYKLYGVTAEQINDVISASDAKQANAKLKALGLNEIANNRLREIILERKQAELDFNDLQIELDEEELERKMEANETIKEIDEEFALSQIEDAEELRDKLIEIEKRKLELKLEDETLLAEEREALAKETESNIKEINDEFREGELEDIADREEKLRESFVRITELTSEFVGAEGLLFASMSANIVKSFEDGKLSIEGVLGAISAASNAMFDRMDERRAQQAADIQKEREEELQRIDEQLDSQLQKLRDEAFKEVDLLQQEKDEKALIELKALADSGDADAIFKLKQIEAEEAFIKAKEEAEEAAAEAKTKLEEETKKKSDRLKLKQFEADKKKALIDIAIATAVGAAKALPNVFLAAAVAVLGAASAALVARKRPPRFEKGTNDIVNIGGSHASGNDVDVWGYSGNSSQYFGKVEKGEAMPVIKKSAVNDYQIAKLNGRFSPSNGRKYQDGTPDITTPQNETQNNEAFLNNLVAAFSNIQIVTKIEDVTKEARKKAKIVSNSKV
jgi:hypothetical protein